MSKENQKIHFPAPPALRDRWRLYISGDPAYFGKVGAHYKLSNDPAQPEPPTQKLYTPNRLQISSAVKPFERRPGLIKRLRSWLCSYL